jgi:hypothetical protein
MVQGSYQVFGRVIDRMTGAGVAALVVEAWDRDTQYHDMLGTAVTDQDGAFRIGFNPDYFGDYGGDQAPDLFFRVYRDEQLLKDTMAESRENQQEGRIEVVIELDLASAPPHGKDRVSSMQALQIARFVRDSDFRGIYRERRDTVSMVGRMIAAAATRSMGEFSFEPIAPEGARNREVVGQGVPTAQANLRRAGAEVSAIKVYAPRLDSATADALGSVALSVRQGDRVTLYEEDGIVRYYTVERSKPTAPAATQDIVRLDHDVAELKTHAGELARVQDEVSGLKGSTDQARTQLDEQRAGAEAQSAELARLRAELGQLRQASSGKDEQIARMHTELQSLRSAQDHLLQQLTPERMAILERLGGQTPHDPPVN